MLPTYAVNMLSTTFHQSICRSDLEFLETPDRLQFFDGPSETSVAALAALVKTQIIYIHVCVCACIYNIISYNKI